MGLLIIILFPTCSPISFHPLTPSTHLIFLTVGDNTMNTLLHGGHAVRKYTAVTHLLIHFGHSGFVAEHFCGHRCIVLQQRSMPHSLTIRIMTQWVIVSGSSGWLTDWLAGVILRPEHSHHDNNYVLRKNNMKRKIIEIYMIEAICMYEHVRSCTCSNVCLTFNAAHTLNGRLWMHFLFCYGNIFYDGTCNTTASGIIPTTIATSNNSSAIYIINVTTTIKNIIYFMVLLQFLYIVCSVYRWWERTMFFLKLGHI